MLKIICSALVLPFILVHSFSLFSAEISPTAKPKAKTILFLGNSLTAGYKLDPQNAFPGLIQNKIDALNWPFEVRNAGLSGETTSGGLRRINWLLKQPADILIIELGGNDGLRGISPEVTAKNLQGIIDKALLSNPSIKIILAGMQVPPNLGQDYTASFQAIFPKLAQKNKLPLIPFLLKDVAGNPKLNLPDGIHPTEEGHKIIAETVWQVLKPVLETQL